MGSRKMSQSAVIKSCANRTLRITRGGGGREGNDCFSPLNCETIRTGIIIIIRINAYRRYLGALKFLIKACNTNVYASVLKYDNDYPAFLPENKSPLLSNVIAYSFSFRQN